MQDRISYGAKLVRSRSRAGTIILEIIAAALIAAALGTSLA
ncbi:MAG TPA: hypothetical protein VGM97_16070 [Steroidobacteraceae bacterium]|jgi:hypothetical protein